MTQRLFCFVGGETGSWHINKMTVVAGMAIANVKKITMSAGHTIMPDDASWLLRGIISNERYASREEKELLVAKQPTLGRPEAVCAALIPIRKSMAWWSLSQDERRRVLEEHSKHIAIGLNYLPAIARRLHHCRDLGENEPFDFLTWFEYAPAHEADFNSLVAQLRASEEWKYVDREIDIRLVREPV